MGQWYTGACPRMTSFRHSGRQHQPPDQPPLPACSSGPFYRPTAFFLVAPRKGCANRDRRWRKCSHNCLVVQPNFSLSLSLSLSLSSSHPNVSNTNLLCLFLMCAKAFSGQCKFRQVSAVAGHRGLRQRGGNVHVDVGERNCLSDDPLLLSR
jgi:hypothetical protein